MNPRLLLFFAAVTVSLPGIPAPSPLAPMPERHHVLAHNQVGFETAAPKRFSAPRTPDGSRFVVRRVGDPATDLFSGVIRWGVGDFTDFQPADSADDYVLVLRSPALETTTGDPFAIRRNLWQEQFWPAALDFMMDIRSVVGTHPSATGGTPWRDGAYYDFAAPSLLLLHAADPAYHAARPRQIDWAADRARVLDPAFAYDATARESAGSLEAARAYYREFEPPHPDAPDAIKLVHWAYGFLLLKPQSRDPSQDPLPEQIHGQTIEQFAYLLHAWPQLDRWLPASFYTRCRDFAFAQWRERGCLEVPALWEPATYLTVDDLLGPNPMGGFLHPFKGRHAPGHSIQPNLLMYEVARREGRADAEDYLRAAIRQTEWLIATLDWADPRTTKGHRMSEFKTITGLVWFLQHHPAHAPAGLAAKIEAWAHVAVDRSRNFWDFRRYERVGHWSIPKLNEPGNLAGFTAAALAAARVVPDPVLRARLGVLAVAQMDALFGRNPVLAAAAGFPAQGFPLVERGWPVHYKYDTTARIETTRGALCASAGSEKYPFSPEAPYRHAEGWVNFNATWNVALAYWAQDRPRP